jgi:hypothetical protein
MGLEDCEDDGEKGFVVVGMARSVLDLTHVYT